MAFKPEFYPQNESEQVIFDEFKKNLDLTQQARKELDMNKFIMAARAVFKWLLKYRDCKRANGTIC